MKVTLPIILMLLVELSAIAQSQKEHAKKYYIDSQNRFYTQASLPAYIFISSSPDGKDPVKLSSTLTPKLANPMIFDGGGTHYLRHQDLHEKTEVTFEVHADAAAPATSSNFNSSKSFHKGEKVYYGEGVEIVLSAKDDMSGVEKIFYSIDGAEYTEYTTPVKIDAEKEFSYKYYAVDNVGNVEAPKTKTFVIDLSKPSTEYTLQGNHHENILSATASILLTSTDAGAGVSSIKYSIDGGTEKVYTAPIKLSLLGEGEHTIKYYGIDNAKNQEEATPFSFYVDKTAPLVNTEIVGDLFVANGKEFSSGRSMLKLVAVDNKAGVKSIFYSINNGKYELYEKPFYLPSKGSIMNIKAYAVDRVENIGKDGLNNNNNLGMNYSMDLTGPTLSHLYEGPSFKTRDTIFINNKTKIKLAAKDLESGYNKILYNLGQGESNYSTPFTVSNEGRYSVEYTGYDNVNNSNNGKFYFIVDNTGPASYPRFSIEPISRRTIDGKEANIYSSHVALFLSATDELVGYDKIYYSLNNGLEKLYTTPVSGFQKGMDYSVKIRAVDKLGNEKTEIIAFGIESETALTIEK